MKLDGIDRRHEIVTGIQQRTHSCSLYDWRIITAKHRGKLGLRDTDSRPGACSHTSTLQPGTQLSVSGVIAEVEMQFQEIKMLKKMSEMSPCFLLFLL